MKVEELLKESKYRSVLRFQQQKKKRADFLWGNGKFYKLKNHQNTEFLPQFHNTIYAIKDPLGEMLVDLNKGNPMEVSAFLYHSIYMEISQIRLPCILVCNTIHPDFINIQMFKKEGALRKEITFKEFGQVVEVEKGGFIKRHSKREFLEVCWVFWNAQKEGVCKNHQP